MYRTPGHAIGAAPAAAECLDEFLGAHATVAVAVIDAEDGDRLAMDIGDVGAARGRSDPLRTPSWATMTTAIAGHAASPYVLRVMRARVASAQEHAEEIR